MSSSLAHHLHTLFFQITRHNLHLRSISFPQARVKLSSYLHLLVFSHLCTSTPLTSLSAAPHSSLALLPLTVLPLTPPSHLRTSPDEKGLTALDFI